MRRETPRIKRVVQLSLFVVPGLLLFSFPGISALEEKPPEKIIFSFLEAFPRAQVSWKGEQINVVGEWKGDRFHFEGMPGLMDIFITDSASVGGKARAAIWIQPIANNQAILTFSNVPPGKKLRLFFAVPDFVLEQGRTNPVFLEVWIGKKRLFEARLNSKGWKEKTLDLTLPFFLQRMYRVQLKVWSKEEGLTALVVYGRVE